MHVAWRPPQQRSAKTTVPGGLCLEHSGLCSETRAVFPVVPVARGHCRRRAARWRHLTSGSARDGVGQPAQAGRTLNRCLAGGRAAPGTKPPELRGAFLGLVLGRVTQPPGAGTWLQRGAGGRGCFPPWVTARLPSPAGRSGAQPGCGPGSGQTLSESSQAGGLSARRRGPGAPTSPCRRRPQGGRSVLVLPSWHPSVRVTAEQGPHF